MDGGSVGAVPHDDDGQGAPGGYARSIIVRINLDGVADHVSTSWKV